MHLNFLNTYFSNTFFNFPINNLRYFQHKTWLNSLSREPELLGSWITRILEKSKQHKKCLWKLANWTLQTSTKISLPKLLVSKSNYFLKHHTAYGVFWLNTCECKEQRKTIKFSNTVRHVKPSIRL